MFRSNRPHVYQKHGVAYGSHLNQWGINNGQQEHRLLADRPIHSHSGKYFQPTGIN